MANSSDGSDDFESTIPINLSKLDPYEKEAGVEAEVDHNTISELDFIDLDTELDDLTNRLEKLDNDEPLDLLDIETAIEPFTATHDPMEQSEDIKTQQMKVDVAKPEEPEPPKKSILSSESKKLIQKKAEPVSKIPPPPKDKLIKNPEIEKDKPMKNVDEVNIPKTKATPQIKVSKAELPKPETKKKKEDKKVGRLIKEKGLDEKEDELVVEECPEQVYVKQKQSLSMLVAYLALVVGGIGLWMGMGANEQVRVLQQKLQNMEIEIHKLNISHQQKAVVSPKKETMVDEPLAIKKEVKSIVKNHVIEIKKVISPKTPVTKVNVPEKNGVWVVNVSSDKSYDLAEKAMKRLAKLGINSVVTPTKIKGATWYRVQILGFESKQEAKLYVVQLLQDQHIEGMWVSKR